MGQFVDAVRQYLPNAYFSLDISPWVGTNGSDNGKDWYSDFDMTKFSFINTSGGSTDATSTKIRSSNAMTWAGVSQVTNKPILADTSTGRRPVPELFRDWRPAIQEGRAGPFVSRLCGRQCKLSPYSQ